MRRAIIWILQQLLFLCCMKEDIEQQNLDKYEADEGFTLKFLELQQEGYFKCGGKLYENT